MALVLKAKNISRIKRSVLLQIGRRILPNFIRNRMLYAYSMVSLSLQNNFS